MLGISTKLSILLFIVYLSFGACSNEEHERKFTFSAARREKHTYGIWRHPMSSELKKTLTKADASWYWIPWQSARIELRNGVYDIRTCEPEQNFPEDLFTDDQLRDGAIVLHFLAVIYGFTLLAIICNDYFIPTVECICEDFNLTKDVAAATFMATATSCPELFTNVMGTFVTESDLGIGTIVGAAIFNCLGVTAIGALFAVKPIKLERFPITRDCLIYVFNVLVLLSIVWDGTVWWYEAMVLVIIYLIYFTTMLNSVKLGAFIRRKFMKPLDPEPIIESPEIQEDDNDSLKKSEADVEVQSSIWKYPRNDSAFGKFWFFYVWPIKFIFTYSIPNPATKRRFYPLTFVICIIYIGVNSYFVSWMITTIGSTFRLTDSVMGLTLLAFGGCMPEACTIFIMSRRGEGGMGISNTMGSNSLAIIFSLGVPWFIKCLVHLGNGQEGFIDMNSSGIAYIVGIIVVSVASIYLILLVGKYYLRKVTGIVMILTYVVLVSVAIMIELGVFFDNLLPECDSA